MTKFKNLEHMITTARVFGHCFDPTVSPKTCDNGGYSSPSAVVRCTLCDQDMCWVCANADAEPPRRNYYRRVPHTQCKGCL